MMSGIKSGNTKPELKIRKALHRLGFRYRIQDKSLPGKPDIVFRKHNAVIFVHGCFWHGHNCHLFKWPKSRPEFWENKINGNIARDKKVLSQLSDAGWRIALVWECSIKGKTKIPFESVINTCAKWLNSSTEFIEIQGE